MTVGNDRAAHPTAFTVSVPLGDVVVRVAGQRVPDLPALLLLHANPGDSRDFDAVIPALAREFTVVTIDWPGYGQSTASNPSQVTAEGLVVVAEQILDALAARGICRLAIIGNSVGGYVAVRLAQRCETTIASLILVDPGGFTPQNAGHEPFNERPEAFLDQVVPFLRQHTGTGHGNSNEIS